MSDIASSGGPAGSVSSGGKTQDEYRLPTDVYPKVSPIRPTYPQLQASANN
jgi:aminopeptidase 2